jgi:glycosyltransferase involved in cell wall biosynthesis
VNVASALIDRPLHVVIVLDHAAVTGGQARVAHDSAIGLKRAGHRPIVFAASGPVDDRLIKAGVEVRCLEQLDLISNPSKFSAFMQGSWNSGAGHALADTLRDLPKGNTIIHVHGWVKALSASIVPAIRSSGHPAVYTLHDYFLFCPTGGFYNYPAEHVCGLTPLSLACWTANCDQRSYFRKLWRAGRQIIQNSLVDMPGLFSNIVILSKFQRDVMGAFLPKQAKLHQISNPIEIEKLGPKADPGSDFIFVGRLSPEKGPFLFAEAARRAGIRPVFIGDGPLLADIAAAYPEARLIGWKTSQEVHALMRDARALVFPSIWFEGQPLSVLEAKALGTPTIVADGCAGREEIEDGVSGLWFKSNDVEDLACAIRRLADNLLAAKLSRQAYESYWSRPATLTYHVQELIALYTEMLEVVA